MEGYTVDERTIAFAKINLVGTPISFAMMALVGLPYVLLHGTERVATGFGRFIESLLVVTPSAVGFRWEVSAGVVGGTLTVLAISIVLHELLHGLGWVLGGGVRFSDMTFGVKSMTPYAHVNQPMGARGYRFGVALPGVVLGLVPGLIALITGSVLLAFYGALMFGAAAGDALMLWLLRDLAPDTLVRDHPEAVGAQVLRPASQ